MKEATRFLWPYLRRYRRAYLLGFGSLAMKDVLGVTIPLMIRWAIDGLTAGSSITTLLKWGGAIIAASAC
jgi:hypothetical protein